MRGRYGRVERGMVVDPNMPRIIPVDEAPTEIAQPPTVAAGTPCPRCNGTGVLYPDEAVAIADECWAANKSSDHGYVRAIRDFRIRTDGVYGIRECQDYINAAKERNPTLLDKP